MATMKKYHEVVNLTGPETWIPEDILKESGPADLIDYLSAWEEGGYYPPAEFLSVFISYCRPNIIVNIDPYVLLYNTDDQYMIFLKEEGQNHD